MTQEEKESALVWARRDIDKAAGDIFKELSRPFPEESISWRAQTVTKDGTKALALAYIDARDVMDRLDEVVTPAGWQNKYSHANGKTVCDIGLLIGGEWVWKADGAGDSDIEAEKGALSDAFKRAAVRWGIGRYLYSREAIWVPCESRDFNGKKQFVKFTAEPKDFVKNIRPQTITAEQEAILVEWIEKTQSNKPKLLMAYNVSSLSALSPEQYQRIIGVMKKKAGQQ